MEFKPLYYRERLTILNQNGDVGIATLWTPPERVVTLLRDLDINTDRIAVIANFYGKGLPELVRNLLWNPQIVHLLVLGQDLSGSRDDLVAFFSSGIEQTLFADISAYRIKGRTRIIDGLVNKDCFLTPIQVTVLGTISDPATKILLSDYFLKLAAPLESPREEDRLYIPIPDIQVARFPSEPKAHIIVRASPLEAWLELMFRIFRFGYWTTLEKGQRRELQNLHVVVTHPAEDPPDALAKFGFLLPQMRDYQRAIIDTTDPNDTGLPYTYGHRLRRYFGIDSLDTIVKELQDNPESRHAYFSLWDSPKDLISEAGSPCLVSLFFRKFDNSLTLTATFRTHNARDAWLRNFYGLMAIQRDVANRVGLPIGAITIISHSITLQKGDMIEAAKIYQNRKSDDNINFHTGKMSLREDPGGYFIITVDYNRAEIILEHNHANNTVTVYRGKNSKDIRTQLGRDAAITLPSHALYVGEQLALAEVKLRTKGR